MQNTARLSIHSMLKLRMQSRGGQIRNNKFVPFFCKKKVKDKINFLNVSISKQVTKKAAQKSNRMSFVVAQATSTWVPKSSGSHICLRRACSDRFILSKNLWIARFWDFLRAAKEADLS